MCPVMSWAEVPQSLSCAGRLSVGPAAAASRRLNCTQLCLLLTREATTTTTTARGARGAVEISNWQTNFPAVCQGVANSVSYIMEQEFYCFRKFQHISPCSFDRRPPPSPMLDARCSVHLPPLWPWPWPAPVKDCHAGIHMSVSVSYPLNCYCITFASTHKQTQSIFTHTQLAITRQTGGLSNRRVHSASRLLASRSHT